MVALHLENPANSLAFAMQAELAVDGTGTTAALSGSYTAQGYYALTATVEDFGVDGVLKFFHRHFGGDLSLPSDVEVQIGSASISFSSEEGFTIEVDSLAVDSYAAGSATIQMSSHGVLIEGSIADVKFAEIISLKQASIQVSLEKVSSQRSTDIALAGEIEIEGLSFTQISAAVHLYKSAGAKTLDWTIYGKFTALGDALTLSSLIHELQNTFLANVSLKELLFIAASRDDPVLSSMNPQKYPIVQGQHHDIIFNQMYTQSYLRHSDMCGTWRDYWIPQLDAKSDTRADSMRRLLQGKRPHPRNFSADRHHNQAREGYKYRSNHSRDWDQPSPVECVDGYKNSYRPRSSAPRLHRDPDNSR